MDDCFIFILIMYNINFFIVVCFFFFSSQIEARKLVVSDTNEGSGLGSEMQLQSSI